MGPITVSMIIFADLPPLREAWPIRPEACVIEGGGTFYAARDTIREGDATHQE